MTSSRLLVVQPSEWNPPGNLADWLVAAGAELEVVRPAEHRLPGPQDEDFAEFLDGYQGVVCLGGEMGAYDDAEFPYLAAVRALLGRAVSRGVPVLAICLGAQLLASATGGQVRRGARGPEAGVLLVAKRDVTAYDPLFNDLPFTPDVLQFHADEIHVLPPTAELLAASPKYDHQAFRVGSTAYGLQFHIETTPEMVLDWVAREPEIAERARPGQFELDALAAAHQDLAETWQPFAERFVQLTAGELTPGRHLGRDLPLV
ncbi:type 1 glutamine amidotransferase [Solihabitans fulvus]|uniref:Type 1 glutamine amidotransferase n=1 Tax=Solihabitans fulvus TaxID=1892852 RepID=A0A5B2W6E1_9PSEU|nr:type 1 glutamine amidotransferase [Solihabitans fulvus]KAA2246076.1 type 1 glutamine amidotransferase [Solihabitans fulvus]